VSLNYEKGKKKGGKNAPPFEITIRGKEKNRGDAHLRYLLVKSGLAGMEFCCGKEEKKRHESKSDCGGKKKKGQARGWLSMTSRMDPEEKRPPHHSLVLVG